MPALGDPTFDQLRIFLAVVETGSFAAAGRRLNRATSVISYGIANLEAQLGLELFERRGTRRPRLTPAGEAVLSEARVVGQGMEGLRARVRGLLQGLEATIDLVVDVMLPSAWLGEALADFNLRYPTVGLNLHVETLGAVTALVLERRAVIGVAGPLAAEAAGLESVVVGAVPLIPVAAPGHPLARALAAAGAEGRGLSPGMGRGHVQLVLTDRSALTEGRSFGVVGARTWRVADLGAKQALLREGIGWGTLPRPMIDADIAAGTLVELAMPDMAPVGYRLSAIHRTDAPPGPAAAWLLQRFVEVGGRGQTELWRGLVRSDAVI